MARSGIKEPEIIEGTAEEIVEQLRLPEHAGRRFRVIPMPEEFLTAAKRLQEEERQAYVRALRGVIASSNFTVEDFLLEKREETEREEKRFARFTP